MVLGEWMLKYMIWEKIMFQTLNLKKGGTMGFEGNQKGKITSMDTIGNSFISINNVWLVDGLKHNLLICFN